MRRLTEEERAMMAEQMDGMGPFRNITGFFGLLMVGKAVPDAVFMYLRKLAGIRGAENLDVNMLGFDFLLALVGGGMIYAAFTFMGPPEVPTEIEEAAPEVPFQPEAPMRSR